MIVKLLTEHHLEFLSFKGGCTGLSESTHVKMSNCWKSHAMAQLSITCIRTNFHSPVGLFLCVLANIYHASLRRQQPPSV